MPQAAIWATFRIEHHSPHDFAALVKRWPNARAVFEASQVKTHKIDARILALLLRAGLVRGRSIKRAVPAGAAFSPPGAARG